MQSDNTTEVESSEQSIFDSNLSVEGKIERARTELLDLSTPLFCAFFVLDGAKL